MQRRKLALLSEQDHEFAEQSGQSQVIEAAIRNYETAFQMQSAIPDVADVAGETAATQRMYGLDSANDYQAVLWFAVFAGAAFS